MFYVAVKMLMESGRSMSAVIDVPRRIVDMQDGAEQYAALRDYINVEFELHGDSVAEIFDAAAL